MDWLPKIAQSLSYVPLGQPYRNGLRLFAQSYPKGVFPFAASPAAAQAFSRKASDETTHDEKTDGENDSWWKFYKPGPTNEPNQKSENVPKKESENEPKQKRATCGRCDGPLKQNRLIRLPCKHVFHDSCIEPRMTECPFPDCGQAISQNQENWTKAEVPKQRAEEEKRRTQQNAVDCKFCGKSVAVNDLARLECAHYPYHKKCTFLMKGLEIGCLFPGCGSME